MSEGAVDLAEIIERQRLNGFIVRLVAVSVLVTFFDGYDMQGIAYVAPYLRTSFHLDKLMLANVFSVGLVGNLIGGFVVGSAGDYFGRRPAIIGSSVAFGVLTCLLALAGSYQQFLVVRLIDGIAIGGMLPVCWALNIEYAPKRFRSTIVTVVMLGYTLGSSTAGPIAVWLIPQFGWPSAFLFGGIGSLMAAAVLLFTLPESIRFLCSRKRDAAIIAAIVRQIDPTREVSPQARFILADEEDVERRSFELAPLFKGELRWITPLLWFGYAISSMAVYFGATWGPIVYESLGFSRSTSALVASINPQGGAVIGLLLMRFTDRYGTIAISVLPVIAVPLLLVCGLVPMAQLPFLVLAFLATSLIVGIHFGMISVAGIFYPSAHRGAGAGWATTISKIGSIGGPVFGGLVLSTHLPAQYTYAILAVCPLLVGGCMFVLGLRHLNALRRGRAGQASDPSTFELTAP